jgi:hypothetical protein
VLSGARRQWLAMFAIQSLGDLCNARQEQGRYDSGCKFARVPKHGSSTALVPTDIDGECPGGISRLTANFLTSISEPYANSHLQFWLGGSELPAMVLLKGFVSSHHIVASRILLPVRISETVFQGPGGKRCSEDPAFPAFNFVGSNFGKTKPSCGLEEDMRRSRGTLRPF